MSDVKFEFSLAIDGLKVENSVGNPVEITLSADQVFMVRDKLIEDNYGNDILWATGDGGLDAFTHGFIVSDQDLWVELKTDNATPEYPLLMVKAGIPVALCGQAGADTTESIDGADLVDGTDYDDVVQIRVQRDIADAVGDATVSLYLFA